MRLPAASLKTIVKAALSPTVAAERPGPCAFTTERSSLAEAMASNAAEWCGPHKTTLKTTRRAMADAAAAAPKRRKRKAKAAKAAPAKEKAPAPAPRARRADAAAEESREATWRDYAFLCVRAVAIVVVFAALDSVWQRVFGRGARTPRMSETEQVIAALCPNGLSNCPYGARTAQHSPCATQCGYGILHSTHTTPSRYVQYTNFARH